MNKQVVELMEMCLQVAVELKIKYPNEQLDPIMACIDITGAHSFHTQPKLDKAQDPQKLALLPVMMPSVIGVVLGNEAWMATKDLDDKDTPRPSERPDRKEALIFEAKDNDRRTYLLTQEFVRTGDKLEFKEPVWMSKGVLDGKSWSRRLEYMFE